MKELQNTNNHLTPGRQIKHSNQLSINIINGVNVVTFPLIFIKSLTETYCAFCFEKMQYLFQKEPFCQIIYG